METNRGECAKSRRAALWTIVAARVGGKQQSAHRATARIRRRSNHFTESVREKVGTRRIRAYRLRANPGASLNVDGEMGNRGYKSAGGCVSLLGGCDL